MSLKSCIRLLFIMVLFGLISCQTEQRFKYSNEIEQYLANRVNLSDSKELYFLLNIDGCDACLSLIKSFLCQYQLKNTTLVFVGEGSVKRGKDFTVPLQARYNYVSDSTYQIYDYGYLERVAETSF